MKASVLLRGAIVHSIHHHGRRAGQVKRLFNVPKAKEGGKHSQEACPSFLSFGSDLRKSVTSSGPAVVNVCEVAMHAVAISAISPSSTIRLPVMLLEVGLS